MGKQTGKAGTWTVAVLLAALTAGMAMFGRQNEAGASGTIEARFFAVTAAVEAPTIAGQYLLAAKNGTGRGLNGAVAKLFLLDVLTNKYVVMEHKTGSVKKDAEFLAEWTLSRRGNPIGERWIVRQGGLFRKPFGSWFGARFNKGAALVIIGRVAEGLKVLQEARAMLLPGPQHDPRRAMRDQNIELARRIVSRSSLSTTWWKFWR